MLVFIATSPIIGFITEVEWYDALGLRDVYTTRLWLEWESRQVPLHQSPGHVVGVEAGAPERLGGHRRPATRAAVEDDRHVASDRVGLCDQLRKLHVAVPGDPPRIVLMLLAYVDQRDLPALV